MSDELTASQCLVITYQMYISTTVRHRRSGCFTKFRIPGANSSFLKVPALGFNFRFNLSFPLPRAIYCNTSSASAVFPWEYSHRGDSGSVLTGKKRKINDDKFIPMNKALKSIFLFRKSILKTKKCTSTKLRENIPFAQFCIRNPTYPDNNTANLTEGLLGDAWQSLWSCERSLNLDLDFCWTDFLGNITLAHSRGHPQSQLAQQPGQNFVFKVYFKFLHYRKGSELEWREDERNFTVELLVRLSTTCSSSKSLTAKYDQNLIAHDNFSSWFPFFAGYTVCCCFYMSHKIKNGIFLSEPVSSPILTKIYVLQPNFHYFRGPQYF